MLNLKSKNSWSYQYSRSHLLSDWVSNLIPKYGLKNTTADYHGIEVLLVYWSSRMGYPIYTESTRSSDLINLPRVLARTEILLMADLRPSSDLTDSSEAKDGLGGWSNDGRKEENFSSLFVFYSPETLDHSPKEGLVLF